MTTTRSVARAAAPALSLLALLTAPAPAQEKRNGGARPAPDLAEVKYGPHARNVLDLWKARSDRPTPLVVFIHGGGFRGGSKEALPPALLQTVYLRNDPEVLKLLDRPGGWLRQVAGARSQDADELIRQAYLRTLSRPPDEGELGVSRKYLADAKDTPAGLRDLLWALVNTKEFVVNR